VARPDRTRGTRAATAAAWLPRALVLAVALAPATAQSTAEHEPVGDEEFIASLGDPRAGSAVDRRKLAKVLFGLAATLDGDKSTVRLLQGQVAAAEGSSRAVRSLIEARYADYLDSLTSFRGQCSELLDEPDSLLLLYEAITSGQRACWQLDLHNLLVDTYAAGGASTLPVLSSREACSRLRTVVFQPRIEEIVREALVDRIHQQERIRTLERDLRDLEELLADLRDIDGGG
jgi:hypothetical protein